MLKLKKDMVKPSILPGFMELIPEEQMLFNRIKDTIRKNYEKYGFMPLDTPVIEKMEVLLAKGGGDTEKQIYEIKRDKSDQALRFDLTVPLARYVSQHYSELSFPFRRYQISKVFRGERNQKGRFREFYQADIDIIGNGDLDISNDAEIPSVIYSTFKDLGFDNFTIRINHRKVLNGFFASLGIEDGTLVIRTIDKIDKIGAEKVSEELEGLGISKDSVEKIMNFINIKGSNNQVIESLKGLSIEEETFVEGLGELETVVSYIKSFGVPEANFKIDLTIARGLDYYTGMVYETILNDHPGIGSVCSGGRYDNLAEYYTKQKLPGVGISIGLTRLFYQLREAKIIADPQNKSLTEVLIVPMSESKEFAIEVASKLRSQDIVSQIYFEGGKMKKKMGYADKMGIRYVVIIGDDEIESKTLTVKDMYESSQDSMTVDELIGKLK